MAADEENGLHVRVLVGGGVIVLMRDWSVVSCVAVVDTAVLVSLVLIHWAVVVAAPVSLVLIHRATLCATVSGGVCVVAATTGRAGGVGR